MQNEKSPVCSCGTCVDIVQEGDLFLVRSTRRVDATPVPFDADEMTKFIAEVKAGKWDAIEASAKAIEARTATV